ncbi:MAG: hypothetical protein U0805_17820 [Pirellulales bacterium]
MTLIELLAVIVIITTLVAAAIPLMSPSNDDRRIRESARGLNTYITGAQARAVSTHRPYGIAIKRLSSDTARADDNSVSLEVFYVEQLPPYTGFDANSRASVAIHPSPPAAYPNSVLIRFITRGTTTNGLPVGWTVDLFPEATIHPGDVVEINGTQFRLLDTADANVTINTTTGCFSHVNKSRVATLIAQPVNDSGQQINPRYDGNGAEIGSRTPAPSPYWTSPATYKILRQPTSTSEEPYQLPEGTAIDLRASGVGSENYFYYPNFNDNTQGILILFTPEGRVGRVSFYRLFPPASSNPNDQPFDQPVVDNVYLLVGRRDRAPAPAAAQDKTLDSSVVDASPAPTDEQMIKLREPINWLSGNSRWIVIGSQTGRVATIENAAVDLAGVLRNPPPPFRTNPPTTAEQWRCAQILAAREFTREMGQLGGR